MIHKALLWTDVFEYHTKPYPCLSKPYSFKFFKCYLPQNLFSQLLNTLSHLKISLWSHSSMILFYNMNSYFYNVLIMKCVSITNVSTEHYIEGIVR